MREPNTMRASTTHHAASPILIANSFPLSLIRRPVRIAPRRLEELRQTLTQGPFFSFWGHANTLGAANRLLGMDITPTTERPVIELDQELFPMADGRSYRVCWVLSPDYRPGFRPAIGEQVAETDIVGWQVLMIDWQ